MQKKAKCDKCGGTGKYYVQNNRYDDFDTYEIQCLKCNRMGWIYRDLTLEERIERIEEKLGIND